jgi:OmpA-OmpF porin, OOP family
MTAGRFFVAVLIAAAGVTASPAVLAQDRSVYYVGASAGTTSLDGPGVSGATSLTQDDQDTGVKIYGGYQFNRNLAVEVGYVDLGTLKQAGTPGPFTVQYDVAGVTAAAVGILPLSGGFSLLGKAGLIFETIDTKTTGPVAVTTNGGAALLVGVGARYDVTRKFGVQVEWEHFDGDITVDFVSAGVRFKF